MTDAYWRVVCVPDETASAGAYARLQALVFAHVNTDLSVYRFQVRLHGKSSHFTDNLW